MIEFLAKVIGVILWIRNMISPVIISVIIGLVIFHNFQNIYGLSASILFLIIGISSGIKLANYLQNKQ